MPSLPTQSFSTIVQNIAAGIQGRANALVNFAIGSTLRAIAEGFAGLFLWFQALSLKLLSAIRLSTSSGTDVDTFTADFLPIIPGSQTAALPGGSPRLGAQAASGQVIYTRFTAAPFSAFVPVGATVQTSDGTQSFAVTANATYSTYSSSLNGYTLAAGLTSLTVPAQAVVAGSGGNVAAGAIAVMTTTVVGIDTVTNSAAFTNGANQESDSALKARFAAYILGLSRGDLYGLTASIDSTEVNVQWTLTEGYNLDGSWHPGYFFVVADDGSGNPSTAFLQLITNAANAVRPLGTQCAVFGPTILTAGVSMTLGTAAGYTHSVVVSQVAATIADNINALGLGNTLEYGMLYSWAYSVPGVTNVTGVLLNGQSGDSASILATVPTQDDLGTIGKYTVKAGAIVVS
jgi:phage-related baseplate assembly protein